MNAREKVVEFSGVEGVDRDGEGFIVGLRAGALGVVVLS